jgi:hypothetical protein
MLSDRQVEFGLGLVLRLQRRQRDAQQSHGLRQRHLGLKQGSDAGTEIERAHNRASVAFLLRKNDQVISDRDCLVFDGIGEAKIGARNDLDG